MTYLCGCYYHGFHPENPNYRIKTYLPLIDSSAHSTILSTTSRTVLKQNFTNRSNDPIKECIYTFPLYDGVSVVSFTCRIGSKILTGVVKEKVKAREIFDKAVAKGETAGLLEQDPQASDVFSIKLGNIPAGESILVEIIYLGELKHHETEGIRFTIPTSIAPRYGSGPSQTLQAGVVPLAVNGGIEVTVDISMPDGSFIKGVQSPSHPIAVSMGVLSTGVDSEPVMSKASATLSLGSTALDQDFVLIVQVKDVGTPKAILESHPTIANHRALMVTLVPKFSLPPSRPEIVFVADRSGSMSGNIAMLVSAMKVFLKSLPVGVKFNICSFGTSNSFLWDKSKGYETENLDQAMAHVETFQANFGGTETYDAIKATVERRFTDLELEIVLLTDGDIWQQEQLFSYVNEQVVKSEGKVRVFPLGIGSGVSHALIEGLARAGNGFAQAVQRGERLDNSVVRMLRGALSPHITNYSLEVKYDQEDDDFEVIDKVSEGIKVLLSNSNETEPEEQKKETISLFDPSHNPEKEDLKTNIPDINLPEIPFPKLLQSPNKIPSLYSFSRTVVYLLMSPETIQRNPTSVVLRATSAHGPLDLEIPVESLPTPAETIHQLAAKKAVQDLEEGRGWIYDAKDQDGVLIKDRFPSRLEDLVKKEAVRLGERYQIANKWCSFVAVSDADGENVENSATEQRDVEMSAKVNIRFASAAHRRPKFGTWSQGSGLREMAHFSGGRSSSTSLDSGQAAQQLRHGSSGITESAGHFRQALQTEACDVFGSATPPAPQPAALRWPANAPQASFGGPAGGAQSRFGDVTFGSAPHANFAGTYQPNLGSPQTPAFGMSAPHANFGGTYQPNLGSPQTPAFGMSSGGPQAGFGGKNVFNAPNANFGGMYGSAGGAPQASFGGTIVSALHANFGGTHDSAQPSFGSPQTPAFGMFGTAPQASFGGTFGTAPQASFGGTFGSLGETESGAFKMGMPATDWKSKSAAEKVFGLITLQTFGGWWPEDNKEVEKIMGFEIPKHPAQVDRRAWVTILVVCFLEQRMESEQGTWGLVVEKAKNWLLGNAKDKTTLIALQEAATEFLKGN